MNISFEKARDVAFAVYCNSLADGLAKVQGRTKQEAEESVAEFLLSFDKAAKFLLEDIPWDAAEAFGIELLTHGLFKLPFPKCYFEWRCGEDEEVWSLFVWEVDGRIGFWNVFPGSGAGAPKICDIEKRVDQLKQGRNSVDLSDGAFNDNDTVNALLEIVAFVGYLSFKGIEMTRHEVRKSVNERRLKQGRSPLPSFVSVKPGVHYVKTNGGGSHASPRPHYRRGHIRRLPNNTLSVVRPTFVNGIPQHPPTYHVKGEAP